MKLSVVIPARNESESVSGTLSALRARLDSEKIDFEMVVVDDGSDDGMAEVVLRMAEGDGRIRLVPSNGPQGFGRAVRLGLEAYTGDAVVITMADGSDDPGDVVKYYYVLRDRAECAFGSRFTRGSRVAGYPPLKLIVNRAANHVIRMLFGLGYNDITNAFKGYRNYVIEGCRPFLSPHFNLTVEIPLKAIVRGYSYQVLPISWQNRKHGRSNLHIPEMGSRYLFSVLVVWLERMLTRNDYYRADARDVVAWPQRGHPELGGTAASKLAVGRSGPTSSQEP